jgi:hypothetical protein
MKHTSVRNIVESAGGLIELSYELELTNNAVRSWFVRGIPRRYWKRLSQKIGVTTQEIEKANRRAVQAAVKQSI